MKRKETSYARQALDADPMFAYHLIGALKVNHEDWLEAVALSYMEEFDFDKFDAEEAQINNDYHLTNPSH